jgi:hypothetical protein
MRIAIYICWAFFLITVGASCVREFNPKPQAYENLLVIDGLLTDSQEPFEVKLSRSIPIDTSAFVPETGAAVKLASEEGMEYNLTEEKPGIYRSQVMINTQVGTAYQLIVQTRNGNQYESEFVTMRETPPIDSVTYRYEERTTAGMKGMQIYTNTHDPTNSTNYYRWEWDESWMFYVPYLSNIIWVDGQILPRSEYINVCWKFGNSSAINIASSNNLSFDRISDYPLLYVSTASDRLIARYSLLVKQYGLSEDSYNYWKELKNVTENLGTLFDPQPSIVKGNVYNINNEDEIVLGYFDATTVSEQRIFILRGELPQVTLPNYYSQCVDSTVSYSQIPDMMKDNWVLVEEIVNEAGFPAYLMSSEYCIDCTLYGTNKRPDYW